MDVNLKTAKVIPFSLSEDDLKMRLLDFLVEDEHAPLDIAYQAKVQKMERHFYPNRYFDVSYSAQWDALSIWEHEEPYTIYQSKTVYIDYYGKEHDSPGFDRYHRGSCIGTIQGSSGGGEDCRPWRVQQKSIPITKYNTVVDNTERTDGSISDSDFVPIVTYYPENQAIATWLSKREVEGKYVDATDELLKGAIIEPLVQTDAYALKTMRERIEKKAASQCSCAVPGTRYKDLNMYDFHISFHMDIVLLPVYAITYEYKGKTYECWRSGVASENFLYFTRPTDDDLTWMTAARKDRLNKQKAARFAIGFAAFAYIPFGMLTTYSNRKLIFFLLMLLEVAAIFAFRYEKNEVKQRESELNNFHEQLGQKRQAIVSIVKDTTMEQEAKEHAIQEILNS